MLTYFCRHTADLDIDKATREKVWEQQLIAVHYPDGKDGKLGEEDNRSTSPDDYKKRHQRTAIKTLNKLAQEGGYVWSEHLAHSEV